MAFQPNPKKEVENSNLLNIQQLLAKNSEKDRQEASKNFTYNSRMFQSMDTSLLETNRLLQMNNKMLLNFTAQMGKTISKTIPKDVFKRKNPNEDLLLELKHIEKEIVKGNNKKIKEPFDFAKMLSKFGMLLGAGGILGFLLTGKTEFLNSVMKSIYKYSPVKIVTHVLDKALTKAAGFLLKGTKFGQAMIKAGAESEKILKVSNDIFVKSGKVSKNITTSLTKSGKTIQKVVDETGKTVTTIMSKSGKVLATTTEVATKGLGAAAKGGAKVVAKGLFKTLGRHALKKIPFIGAAFGLWFGIERIKKGDIVGGALEIISGATSFIPLLGLPLGIAIDAFLLMRDAVGTKKVDKAVGGVIKKVGLPILRNIPGIGTIVGIVEGISLWKTSKKESIKSFGRGITSLIPGAGFLFDMAFSVIDKFNIPSKIIGGVKATGTVLKSLPWSKLKMYPVIGPIAGIMDALGKWKTDKIGAVKDVLTGLASIVPGGGAVFQMVWSLFENLGGGSGSGGSGSGSGSTSPTGDGPSLLKGPTQTKKSSNFSMGSMKSKMGAATSTYARKAASVGRAIGRALFPGAFAKSGVTMGDDTGKIKPSVLSNLQGMASEYKQLTGHDIQINDAYRSPEEQNRLNALYVQKYGVDKGNKMAPKWNGANVHWNGVALDMQTPNALELQSIKSEKYPDAKNMMEAWGFWPAGLTFPVPETWHIESEATKPWRSGGRKGQIGDTTSRGGGNLPLKQNTALNLPSTGIPSVDNNGSGKMDLSESTIALLAKSITEGYKSVAPKSVKGSTNIQTNARG